MQDPNPLVSGSGFQKLMEAGVEVVIGWTHADTAQRKTERAVLRIS